MVRGDAIWGEGDVGRHDVRTNTHTHTQIYFYITKQKANKHTERQRGRQGVVKKDLDFFLGGGERGREKREGERERK